MVLDFLTMNFMVSQISTKTIRVQWVEETLSVMWDTIQKNKQPLVNYLTRKANLFGKEKMEWQDQDAPIILGDLKEKTFSFDEAAAFIIENFNKFSPKMAKFAQSAFEKSWIEAKIVLGNVLVVIVLSYQKQKNQGSL